MEITMTEKSDSVTARWALSPFTLAPEPVRRSYHRDKSDHVHTVPKQLSVRA